VSGALRDAATRRGHARGPLRQRLDLPEPAVSGGGRDYRLTQEFITPYTPEQNGIIERFFRSLKEGCVWQHNFTSFDHARRELTAWIRWYNDERPLQVLGYRSPREFRAREVTQVP
jgi:transposase InsO family protein